MAIVKIDAPGTTPSAFLTPVIDQLEALILGNELPLRIIGTNVVRGALFNIGGVRFIADADTAITGTPSDYVKLTPGATTATASYVANLTGVTWNSTYNGYYDGGGNLYIFDELKAYKNDVITEIITYRSWNPTPWADYLGANPNTSVTDNNSATVSGIDPVNGTTGTYGTFTVTQSNTTPIPKGTYMITNASYCYLQIKDTGSNWYGGGDASGLIISDGVNYRLRTTQSTSQTVYYRKLA